jgi:hypothetical protein
MANRLFCMKQNLEVQIIDFFDEASFSFPDFTVMATLRSKPGQL